MRRAVPVLLALALIAVACGEDATPATLAPTTTAAATTATLGPTVPPSSSTTGPTTTTLSHDDDPPRAPRRPGEQPGPLG